MPLAILCGDFKQRIAYGQTSERIIAILEFIAQTLSYVVEKDIIRRDVKP